jgi:hemolysin activation/secretion protein/AraC-like DNA-binding protein
MLNQSPGWLMARVAEGVGYWLHQGSVRELSTGDVVLAARSNGIVRASELGPMRIQFFSVQPRLLDGVLSVADWQQLEPPSRRGSSQAFVWSAQDAVAQRFSELVGQPPPATGLSLRCRLLLVWADAVAGLMARAGESPGSEELRERVHQLLSQISEAELAGCSLRDLAGQLQCSQRHLSRLLHDEFGVPFRAHQIETRLLRARRLLEETDAKIVSVAYESGYRHLGLFNTMFKKRFGVTPSECRKRWRRKPHHRAARAASRASLLLVVFVTVFWQTAFAQTNAPATAVPAPPKFEVRAFDVRGNTLLKPKTISAILDQATGKEVTIEQIRKALSDLKATYRERGYVTVDVSLPQQQLTNATVIVQVTEAPISSITVINNRFYSSNNIMRALPSLHTNMLLNSHVLQRELDLANANRDRQIYGVLGPGAEPGTSELTLKVQDRFPLHGRMDLDNYYTPDTPELRLNFSLQYNNLWNLDHQIGAQYSFSPQESKTSNLYVESIFDEPLIANYSAYYRFPLSNRRPVQEGIDTSPFKFGYNEATHQFQLPPPTGQPELTIFASRSTQDTGIKYGVEKLVTQGSFITIVSQDTGEDITLNSGLGTQLNWPLPELFGVRSSLSLGLNFKLYRLSSFNTNNFFITTTITNSSGSQTIETVVANGQPPRYTSVDYLPFSVGWDGSVPDKLGTTFLNANLNFNVPNLVPYDSNRNFAQASYSPKATANYVTLNLGLNREQTIYKDWSVMLTANGQWADGPLISNEQFAMGGLAGVRGYLDGQVYGDKGWRVQIEPHTPLINIGMVDETIPFWLRGSIFVGYGETYLCDPPTRNSSPMKFWGAGFGITATIGQHLDGRLTVAWPLLNIPGVDAGTLHIYFSLGAQF